jgi:hypothetical protein
MHCRDKRVMKMKVEGTLQMDFAMAMLQKSIQTQGDALIQLFEAYQRAERAQSKPLANLADVNKVDISV